MSFNMSFLKRFKEPFLKLFILRFARLFHKHNDNGTEEV